MRNFIEQGWPFFRSAFRCQNEKATQPTLPHEINAKRILHVLDLNFLKKGTLKYPKYPRNKLKNAPKSISALPFVARREVDPQN